MSSGDSAVAVFLEAKNKLLSCFAAVFHDPCTNDTHSHFKRSLWNAMAVPTASEINKRMTTPDVMPIIVLISSGCRSLSVEVIFMALTMNFYYIIITSMVRQPIDFFLNYCKIIFIVSRELK